MSLFKTIEHVTTLGYKVSFEDQLGHNYITCSKEGKDFSSAIPDDHFDERQIVRIIEFNIDRLRNET